MIKKIVLSVFAIALMIACSDSDDAGPSSSSDNFDRQAMLINWADNIIIPAFQDLNSDLTTLTASKDAFLAAPSQTTLDATRAAWLEAYKTWQYVEMFNIGRAEEINYANQMNIYPANVINIQNNISLGSGNYDLSSPSNNSSVGFPTVDYMLYGIADTDANILTAFSNDANAQYLSDVVDQMESLTAIVLDDWTTSYRDVFVNSTANSATSSTNKLTNDYIFYYEKGLRATKVGIPAGVFSSTPLADRVEAFYSEDASKVLATEALQAVQDFFNGKAYNSAITGESFNSYLNFLNTIKNGEDLSALINDQFNTAAGKLELLDDDFSQQVETNNTAMLEAYDELQRAVVLLKVDMVQAINISVDFVDADGD